MMAKELHAEGYSNGAGALRVAIWYLITGVLWILLSDRLLGILASDYSTWLRLQSLKGTIFVLGSSAMMYWLVRRALRAVAAAEKVRRRSERRFRALVENISDAVTVVRLDGTVAYVSPAFEQITGYSNEERLGKSAFERVHPGDLEHVRRHFGRLLAEPAAEVTVKARLRHKDGSWRTIRLVGHNLVENPAVGGILVTYSDVTERVQVEARLRESEERFRLMVEGSEQVFFYEHDPRGVFRYLSPSIENVLGYEPEELLGRRYTDLLTGDPTDVEVHRQTERSLEHPGRSEPYTAVTRARDGSVVELELIERPLLRDGIVVGLQGFGRDITQRNAAERRLRESEQRFRSLIENSSDTVCVLDRRGAIRFQSSSVRRLTTYEPEDLVGRLAARFVHPEDRGKIAEAFRNLLATDDKIETWEFRYRRKDGGTRFLAATAHNRLSDPTIRGVVVNARDVTGSRAVEDQLRQAQKMEAVGRLAGGVAHDFNNILTAITGHADMLLRDLSEGHDLREDAEEIARSAGRAASLTRQLLAFSRQQVLRPRVLDLNAVISEMETMLRRLIGEHILLKAALEPQLPSVQADPGQVQQVIMNLVVNARDAMPEGGRITVRTRTATLSPAETQRFPYPVVPGPYVLLCVSDTGEGMDEDTVAQIFEPFFTTKAKGKGTGLGLSTVYGIVKQSGGYIWADSEPGLGTAFRVYLPISDESAAPEPMPAEEPEQGGETTEDQLAGTVLVVEDETPVRQLVQRVLARHGYTTLVAPDGDTAIEIASAHEGRIDVLLTDLVMPGFGGSELGKIIRLSRPHTKVVVMSGYAEDERIRADIGRLGAGFLEKPFSPAELLRAVNDVMQAPTPASGRQLD